MTLDAAALIRRINELLRTDVPRDSPGSVYAAAIRQYQGTLTLVTTLYGTASHQAHVLLSANTEAAKYVGDMADNLNSAMTPYTQTGPMLTAS